MYEPQSLCTIPDKLLLEIDCDSIIEDLKDGIHLTDRQLLKLEKAEAGEKTKLLVKMLKEHHDAEGAYSGLLEALKAKNWDLYNKMSSKQDVKG